MLFYHILIASFAHEKISKIGMYFPSYLISSILTACFAVLIKYLGNYLSICLILSSAKVASYTWQNSLFIFYVTTFQRKQFTKVGIDSGFACEWLVGMFMRTAKIDQTAWMPRLNWVFILLVCHAAAHLIAKRTVIKQTYTPFKLHECCKEIGAALLQNQQNDCAPSQDSDQPGHPPSLIRVFTVCMKKAWVLSNPLSAQWRLLRLGGCPAWSESSLNTQSFCWFSHKAAHLTSMLKSCSTWDWQNAMYFLLT